MSENTPILKVNRTQYNDARSVSGMIVSSRLSFFVSSTEELDPVAIGIFQIVHTSDAVLVGRS
jgi:hypothetical protein